jgi:hypothetical protein
MYVAIRFMTGFAVGLEFAPQKGMYLSLYLGIIEVVFYSEEDLEDIE